MEFKQDSQSSCSVAIGCMYPQLFFKSLIKGISRFQFSLLAFIAGALAGASVVFCRGLGSPPCTVHTVCTLVQWARWEGSCTFLTYYLFWRCVLLRTFREEPRYRNMSKDRAGTDSANTALNPARSLDRIANASIETDHFGQRSIPF